MEEFWRQALALGSAVLLSGLIGLERELRGEWAGLRTHMLVALVTALFVLSGMSSPSATPADLSRIIQGIATGIGFIGGGTILKLTDKLEVRGLTTAASIWLAAALGIACGLGLFALAALGVGLTLVILYVLRKAEPLFLHRRHSFDKAKEQDKKNAEAPASPNLHKD
jgi:putative Mg2+ transporter-C (MgtC) family protein